MAKKMVLIDPQELKSLKAAAASFNSSPIKDPIESSLNRLSQRMDESLNQSTKSEEERATDYQQNLQKFMKLAEQFRNQPIGKVEIAKDTTASSKTNNDGQLDAMKQDVISNMPKTFKEKARRLLVHLDHIPNLKWTDKGEMVISDQVIPGTNIRDLFSDVLRKKKTMFSTEQGLRSFVDLLKSTNVSRELIPSARLWERGYPSDRSRPMSRGRRMLSPSPPPQRSSMHMTPSWFPISQRSSSSFSSSPSSAKSQSPVARRQQSREPSWISYTADGN